MQIKTSIAFLVGILTGAAPLFGGTVITNNLPANTAIINISGTADGAAHFNGDQSLWYQPFNTGGTLLAYAVQSGTYTFRVVNPADAAKLFPTLSPAQTNQIFTAWTYNSPWALDYLVFDDAAATNTSLPQLFDGAPEPSRIGSAADAYQASIAHGTYNEIRVGPLGRASTNITTFYTFTKTVTLIFVVPDYILSDNNGGVSVLIQPAGPPLSIIDQSGAVTLQWSTDALGFALAQTPSLPATSWTIVTAIPNVLGTTNSVTLPLNPGSRFFRLQKP